MKAGKYVFVVSPVWNECANEHEDYKTVFIEILAQEKFIIKELNAIKGYSLFEAALINHARNNKQLH